MCFRLLDFNLTITEGIFRIGESLLVISIGRKIRPLTITEGIFRIGKSVLVISIGRKIRLLDTFGLGLSVRKISLRFDSAFIGISHILRNKTIRIGLRSLGCLLSGALIEFLNAGSLLVNIRDGVNLGILGSNLIHSGTEATRKKFVILDTLDNIKNFVRLVDADSLGLNFQTISVSQLGLCPNIFSLNTLQSGFAKR